MSYESATQMSNCFSSQICPPDDVYLYDLTLDTKINLLHVNQLDTDAFCKKMMDLFKKPWKMKENMTVSGTHNNNPWNFVKWATSGRSGFTKVAICHFYQWCEANSDIDSFFQPFLDPSMQGDTVSLLDKDDCMEDVVTPSSKTKQNESMNWNQMQRYSVLWTRRHNLEASCNCSRRTHGSGFRPLKYTNFCAHLEVTNVLGDREELKNVWKKQRQWKINWGLALSRHNNCSVYELGCSTTITSYNSAVKCHKLGWGAKFMSKSWPAPFGDLWLYQFPSNNGLAHKQCHVHHPSINACAH